MLFPLCFLGLNKKDEDNLSFAVVLAKHETREKALLSSNQLWLNKAINTYNTAITWSIMRYSAHADMKPNHQNQAATSYIIAACED